MTELSHGSDVKNLETTATYDENTKEFVINTPHSRAMKFWIGGLAETSSRLILFAQLITKGKGYGVHLFEIPIRDVNFNALPGVSIGDCGPKQGCDGVDNGWVMFENYRVPKGCLLNKFADVSDNGTYFSIIKSDNKRFGT